MSEVRDAVLPDAAAGGPPDHDVRAVLRLPEFRRLWVVLSLSSFGDWLGLLATAGFAALLAGIEQGQDTRANLAVAATFALRLAPALLLGPLAGVVADRFDRRVVLVAGDVIRGLLYLSIPLVGQLWWLFVAILLTEIVALFWMPAKDAALPTLVPPRRLEAANQLSVLGTYGTAPLAAAVFLLLSAFLRDQSLTDVALVLNGVTFLAAGVVIAGLPIRAASRALAAPQSVWADLVEGWRYVFGDPFVRGLVGGMLGAFAAAGTVIGLGITYVTSLGMGLAGYGLLFGAAFLGMALGVWQAPRSLRQAPRRRLFGTTLVVAGVFLVAVGLSPHIAVSTLAVVGLGIAAGAAWVTGQTLLGGEVDDALRGRTFAFVQTGVRVVLVAVMAVAPLLAALIGDLSLGPIAISGAGAVFVLAGLGAVAVGVAARSAMSAAPVRAPSDSRAGADDTTGATVVQLRPDAPAVPAHRAPAAAPRRHPARRPSLPPRRRIQAPEIDRGPEGTGYFVAVEGGDGAGKTTQVQLLVDWLIEDLGHECVMTREPGGTTLGRGIRGLVLTSGSDQPPVPRAEALLFAADRAHHVETVIRPALARGSVVVTDRYIDSSLAYQGARGDLARDDIAYLSQWATGGLVPDLTVVLDVPADVAAVRLAERRAATGSGRDRMEGEPEQFHRAVRDTFLDLAAADPGRYVVVDAARTSILVADDVQRALRLVLPLSRHQRAVMSARLAADADGRRVREAAAVAEARTWLAPMDPRL